MRMCMSLHIFKWICMWVYYIHVFMCSVSAYVDTTDRSFHSYSFLHLSPLLSLNPTNTHHPTLLPTYTITNLSQRAKDVIKASKQALSAHTSIAATTPSGTATPTTTLTTSNETPVASVPANDMDVNISKAATFVHMRPLKVNIGVIGVFKRSDLMYMLYVYCD